VLRKTAQCDACAYLLWPGHRDEFHARPTAPLSRWNDAPPPQVIGGRDLRSGGGWAGVAADRRMAVVINMRDPMTGQAGKPRGALVADYLRGTVPARRRADPLAGSAGADPPFNLLLADADSVEYVDNHPVVTRACARACTACPTARSTLHGRRHGD